MLCIKLVKYWDKYTEMHGQQNVKKKVLLFSMVFNCTLISIYVILPNDLPIILFKMFPCSFTLQKQFVSVSSNEQIMLISEHNNSTQS